MRARGNRMALALAILALVQTGVLAGMVWNRTWLLATGREIVLPIVPVDPRDLFRGEYVELVPNERLRYTDKFDDPNLRGSASGDGDTEASIRRYRAKHRPGRPAGCHPTRGVLPRLARVAAKLGEARRT